MDQWTLFSIIQFKIDDANFIVKNQKIFILISSYYCFLFILIPEKIRIFLKVIIIIIINITKGLNLTPRQ